MKNKFPELLTELAAKSTFKLDRDIEHLFVDFNNEIGKIRVKNTYNFTHFLTNSNPSIVFPIKRDSEITFEASSLSTAKVKLYDLKTEHAVRQTALLKREILTNDVFAFATSNEYLNHLILSDCFLEELRFDFHFAIARDTVFNLSVFNKLGVRKFSTFAKQRSFTASETQVCFAKTFFSDDVQANTVVSHLNSVFLEKDDNIIVTADNFIATDEIKNFQILLKSE